MKRNLDNLTNTEFDVLVVGGGIYGVTTAWDAVLRGFSVALIEKSDFGSGTSANSLKIVHGGLRYLQHADFKRMRESIRERTTLMRIAPHLVHPLPCVMPTYGHMLKGREVMGIALLMNDIISLDRNRVDDPQKHLPRGRILSQKEILSILPGLPDKSLSGGALWYDCQMYNSDRLLLSFVISAANAGAQVANYVEMQDFILKNNHVIGVRVKDQLTGESCDIRAKVTVNNTGAWVNRVLGQLNGNAPKIQLSTALNLVVNREIVSNYGAGISSRKDFRDDDAVVSKGSRLFFMAPWRGYSLIGTNHLPFQGDPNNYKTSEYEIQKFLQDVNEAYPAAQIKRDEVTYFYGGFLPMDGTNNATDDVKLTKQYKLIDHHLESGIDGLISVSGVKFTTARDVAEKTMDMVSRKLGKWSPSASRNNPIYGGDIERFDDFMQEVLQQRAYKLQPHSLHHLAYNYGSAYPTILKYIDDDAELGQVIDSSSGVVRAEIVHAVREEMALTLADVIMRRTELGSAGNPGDECLARVADIVANELGWDRERRDSEIKRVQDLFVPSGS